MTPFSPLLFTLGLCATGSGLLAAVSLDGLVTDSPFVVKDPSTAPVVVTENAAVEFRGMISTKEGVFFGLYDRTKQTGTWVRKEDKGTDFTVRSYDAATDTVSVEYLGQKYTLPLSASKIVAASAASVPMISPQQGNAPIQVNAQPAQVNRADDARRLESVAAEVRRRRALRQAGGTAGGTAPAATGTRQ